jgi:thioester reductase-like protein
VFHAAGVVDDGMLSQQTRARLDAVYRPKAEAAWHLHEATRGEPVDHFVLFSSLAAVFGSPGQSTYVAANAALDALAQHRHRLGLPALSIAWGPWATGMAGRLGEREHARLTALGLTPYSPADGAQTFLDLLDSVEPHVIAAQLNPNALLAHLGSQRPPLLRALDQAKQAGPQVRPLRDELLAGPAADRREQLSALLCRRFGELLGLPAGEVLTRDRALSTIGFDSLMAVELKSWIGGELGVEIPMEQLPGLTIDAVADTILKSWHPAAPAAPEVTSERSIEATLRADAVLPDDLQVPARNGHPPMRNVLLTGATGFLGAFLLHEILSNTHATIRCLVRARTPESGRRRILENLAAYKLSSPKALHRIVAIPGDLAEPRLGLSAGDFDELATAVDTIIHNGAWLNFFYSYPMLRAANVQGTLEVLRLACQGAAKPVHYVSTSGVFYSRSYHGQVLPETNFAERCEGHALGYSQSKWVAERLMHAAADRGLPVTIHRAPFITGDRRTGAWNSDDFICRLVRGIVALGVMPDLAATMDIVPVDYVARAIVRVALEPVSPARVFHLAPREPVPWTRLAAWLAQRGYSVGKEPYADWLARLPALRGTEHPLAPFIPLFLEKTTQGRATVLEVFLQSVHSRLDSNATTAVVSNFGITPPVIDGDLWNTYLAALERDGMLPDPTPTHERPAP